MRNFNDDTYNAMVKDLINDAFYIENRSTRGIIATIRTYSEVIVRRILDLPKHRNVTLGDKEIELAIKTKSNDNTLLINALNNIRKMGNRYTHTQYVREATEKELKEVFNNLFELYAYLFIEYFERYEFGKNLKVVAAFSILPPIIRYITLEYLNDKYPNNVIIIDKLSLAILKAFDEQRAFEWIENRKTELEVKRPISNEVEANFEKEYGKEALESLKKNSPENMYILCREKVKTVSEILNAKGKAYNDFESAVELYAQKGILDGTTNDISEFNSIMHFVYLGRVKKDNEKLKNIESYQVIKFE